MTNQEFNEHESILLNVILECFCLFIILIEVILKIPFTELIATVLIFHFMIFFQMLLNHVIHQTRNSSSHMSDNNLRDLQILPPMIESLKEIIPPEKQTKATDDKCKKRTEKSPICTDLLQQKSRSKQYHQVSKYSIFARTYANKLDINDMESPVIKIEEEIPVEV